MQHSLVEGDEERADSGDGALAKQEHAPSAVLACLPYAAVMLDRSATIVGLNDAALRLLSGTRETLVGRAFASLFSAHSGEAVAQLVAAATPVPCTRSEHWLLRRGHGAPIPTQVTLAALPSSGGVVGTIVDLRAQLAAEEGQREAEAQVRELTHSMPQLVWRCLPNGSCDLLNQRWLEFTGVPESEQLGIGWTNQVHPDDRERLFALGRRVNETGEEFAAEFRLRRHDGEYRWFDARALALRSKTGEIVKWLGSNTEIHESRTLREHLRIERERQATILECSPGAVVSFERSRNGQMKLSFVSAGAHALLGFTPEEIEADAQRLVAQVPSEDLERLRSCLEHSARERRPLACEFRYLHPTEGEKWLEARSTPRFHADERVEWCALVTDTSRSRRAEEALKLTRAQLESALEAAEMGAWVWDYESNVLWGSESQRRIWQLPAGTPSWFDPALVSTHMHPGDIARVLADSAAAVEAGKPLETEFRILTPGGERWMASRARVEQGIDGRSHRLAGVNLDVTKQKIAAETELRSQKLEALGTLAGGIAHDFNNMLFAISGNAVLALSKLSADSEVRPFLDEITSASSRATDLVRQILAFSRPQDQKREVMRLLGPVQEALRLMRATVPAMIEIRAELDPETPAALVDAARVVQIVVNLCTNAVHAIGKERSGLLEVRLEPVAIAEGTVARVPAGSYARLSVRDDGCGIDEATQSRIFDPFFTTKAPGEGTGLGLSVVHGIVRALGGHLTLWSKPDEGALFQLYFPSVKEVPRAPSARPEAAPGGNGKRVLFVDDESVLVALGKSFLEILGYQPDAFQDPRDALAAFYREPDAFAALVTDLSMPGLSGFDLVRSLRTLRADLPVLMISGNLGPEERKTAAQLGIQQLALKPVSVKQLGELLERLC